MGPAGQTDAALFPMSQTLALLKLDGDRSNWVLYEVQIISC